MCDISCWQQVQIPQGLQPGQTFQKACNWVTSKLPGWLSGIWNSVWAMIQRLATPRSWTISGGITAPSLGLTSASISITFG